jgi:hypothetical protein
MVVEHAGAHASQWAAITSIAEKIGCAAETLRSWVRQAERDAGQRPGLTTDERGRLKQLERENFELRRANEILKQALYARPFAGAGPLVHHSDRGVQYLSIRYTERLAEAGIERSVGSAGDSYDNALAESVIGLFKTEVIRRRGPWRGVEDVEFATLE